MASDQNLILEIEEALKREKTEKLFKEYGPYILAGALLAILFTGIMSGYRSWESRANAENTALLMEAMDNKDQVKALEEVAPKLRPGQRAIALMTAANVLLSQDKPAEAKVIFGKTAADKALPAMYRDLAALMNVRLTLSGETKNVDAAGLLAQLQPLMGKSNPWRWHAYIEAALIAAHLQNDYASARKHLEAITTGGETNVPPSVMNRARELDQVFSQKLGAVKKTDTTSPDAEG